MAAVGTLTLSARVLKGGIATQVQAILRIHNDNQDAVALLRDMRVTFADIELYFYDRGWLRNFAASVKKLKPSCSKRERDVLRAFEMDIEHVLSALEERA